MIQTTMFTKSFRKLLLAGILMAACFTVPSGGKADAPADPPALGYAQGVDKLNRLLQSSDASDQATRMFKEARDLVQNEDWESAIARLEGFIDKYSNDKRIDAALYWLAFSFKQDEQLEKARKMLERLMKEYPKSTWFADARTMKVEIAPQLGDGAEIARGLTDSDNNIEIKTAALQSLFQTNAERATGIVAEMFKPESKADHRLKDTAISLLGQHHGPQTTSLLSSIARNERDSKLRKNAIFWLGQTRDESVFELLSELASKSDDPEVAKAALFSISQHGSPRATQILSEVARNSKSVAIRKEAIFGLSQRRDETAAEELFKIYDADHDTEIRKQVLFAFAQMRSARAQAKLLEVAKSADNVEVRKQAIFWIGQRHGEQAVVDLVQLYDTEKSADIREQILFALSQSRQKQALHKLMEVARSDASIEIRKKAIFWLGHSQSRDPEVLKFLEELLTK